MHPAYHTDGPLPTQLQLRHIAHPERHTWGYDARFAQRMGWPDANHPDYPDYSAPSCGTPDPRDLDVLVETLVHHTGTADKILAFMWCGWGSLESNVPFDEAMLCRVGRERFGLLQGTLLAVPGLGRQHGYAPSYWWPLDRAWGLCCVGRSWLPLRLSK